MNRFKNILVAMSPGTVDASALRRVGELAVSNDATLTVLDPIEPLPASHRLVNVEGRKVDLEEMMVEEGARAAERAADLTGHPEAVSAVRVGKPFVEVIHHVLENGCDLVVVGDPLIEGPHGPGVSPGVMQLVRKCPVPVWVMRPSTASTLRILALVDPDPEDPVRDELNTQVLELATSLAGRIGGELHVAHAWDLPGEATMRSSMFLALADAEVDLMVRSAADDDRRRLQALADRHGVAEMGGELHIVKGPARDVLPLLAQRLDIGLIVMGTVARTGLSGLIMGNTAESILRSIDSSVLALKPKGFVSPVHPPSGGVR